MNLGMVSAAFTTAKNWTVQHSPEILLGTSIAAGIGATVTGCIAMTKMEGIRAKHKEILDILHQSGSDGEINGEEIVEHKDTPEYKRAITKEYGRYALDIVKAWAPCVSLTLLSGTSALASFKIVNKRLMIAETAFAGIAQTFEQYRNNVIEDQGEEKDLYYANNGALKKKQELIAKGKAKTPADDARNSDIVIHRCDNVFTYFFNENSVKWGRYSTAPFYNMKVLNSAVDVFNQQLRENGVVLLDEIYTYLGLDLSSIYAEKAQGRTYGWTLDGYAEKGMPSDDQISFGIFEYNDTQHRLFRSGDINDIVLNFNCRLLTKETCELLAKG